jgi:hypothetical protein
LRLAVEHGQGWVTIGTPDREGGPAGIEESIATVSAQLATLDEACVAAGRDPATLDRYVLTGLNLTGGLGSEAEFEALSGRYEELGVSELVVHWPRPAPPYEGDEATFERIFAQRI